MTGAERSHLVPFVALIGKLRLAHQELPPSNRLQLRPIAAIGKLRPPRKNTRPCEAAELIPAGESLRHFRLGNDQPFPSPSIILRGIDICNHILHPLPSFLIHKVPPIQSNTHTAKPAFIIELEDSFSDSFTGLCSCHASNGS